MRGEEARQQAEAEELTLLVAENKAGYFGVYHQPGRPKPYLAQVTRGGKTTYLGRFATAEEAALCVARSPEGQEAAKRAAVARPLASEQEVQGAATATRSGAVLKEEGVVPPMPPDAYVKEEEVALPLPSGAFFKEENVPPMPPDAVVKRERELVVTEEERSDDGPKRRRSK